MSNPVFNEIFLYICDNKGNIETVVNALKINEQVVKDKTIFEKVLPESETIWFSFIKNFEAGENSGFWKGIVTCLNLESYACFITVLDNNQVLVLGMKENSQDYLTEEILKLNGKLTNKVRMLSKEKNVTVENAYEQISQMNNELANARRELKKKNCELEQLNLQLEKVSVIDYLTGLYNRRYLATILFDVVSKSKNQMVNTCLIMIDINDFKMVNDTLGHDSGDLVLIHLANCLKATFRNGQDTLFRFGGDEFLILLESTNYNDCLLTMKRLNDLYLKDAKNTSLAVGIVEINYEEISEDFSEHLKKADHLMYLNKMKLKNR